MRDVYIVAAKRSPIGSFGGSLASLTPAQLGSQVARAVLAQVAGSNDSVGEVIVGNVLAAGHGMNIARQVSLGAGLPVEVPAYTVNKVCGSGLKAVTLGATAIASGEQESVLVGGVESMSQAGFVSLSSRWGAKMGHQQLVDLMINDGLTDVFGSCHMGITAENLAKQFDISRAAQDSYAALSQARAAAAQAAGHFDSEISAIEISSKKGTTTVDRDEYIRADTTVESLAKLKPAFDKNGTVTAGNASGINDGAAFVLLMSKDEVAATGSTPIARIVASAAAGVSPEVMGIGPVAAVRKLLKTTGISLDQITTIEANEAFAVQALAVAKELELDAERTNSWGGAIALGHPIGASGARVLVTLLSRMVSSQSKYGLATLCIGGGQGIAVMVERS